MVQNIQMDEATLAALRILQSQALRRGEALGPYLQSLAERAETQPPDATPVDDRRETLCPDPMTGEEYLKMMDAILEDTPEGTPVLPADFSRADIYEDHD